MKDQLIFTTGDLANSDQVGASVISKGAEIDHQTVNSEEWLNTASILYDDAGNAINDANPLPVDIQSSIVVETDVDGVYNGVSNTDPDNAGMILHSRAAALDDTTQIERTTAGGVATVASADISNINAIDVNAFSFAANDTSGDLELLSKDDSSGGLNVHIADQDGDVAVSDAALGNTAVASGSTALAAASTAESVVGSALSNRKYLWVYNNSNKRVFLGGSGVSESDGFPVSPGSYMEMRAGASVDVQVIGPSSGLDVRTLELS